MSSCSQRSDRLGARGNRVDVSSDTRIGVPLAVVNLSSRVDFAGRVGLRRRRLAEQPAGHCEAERSSSADARHLLMNSYGVMGAFSVAHQYRRWLRGTVTSGVLVERLAGVNYNGFRGTLGMNTRTQQAAMQLRVPS